MPPLEWHQGRWHCSQFQKAFWTTGWSGEYLFFVYVGVWGSLWDSGPLPQEVVSLRWSGQQLQNTSTSLYLPNSVQLCTELSHAMDLLQPPGKELSSLTQTIATFSSASPQCAGQTECYPVLGAPTLIVIMSVKYASFVCIFIYIDWHISLAYVWWAKARPVSSAVS